MKNKILYSFGLVLITSLLNAGIKPVRLTCEYLNDPQVVDMQNPRLSWINIPDAGERGQLQTAWEIRVAGSKEKLFAGNADLWNSGRVISNESDNIPYKGKALVSRQDCWWQVRVWDRRGKVSGWSDPAFWSMGILKPEEWKSLSLNDRAIYLMAYLETVYAATRRAKDAANERKLDICIASVGIEGLISSMEQTKIEWQFPLPWSVSRAFGSACKGRE